MSTRPAEGGSHTSSCPVIEHLKNREAVDTQSIKTKLIDVIGEKPTAFLQALRFVYLLYARPDPDPEVELLPGLIGKGDTVVDVGANEANWTYWLYRSVGKTGAVYAFEAEPYYAVATARAMKLLRLKSARLFPFALGDAEEEVALRVAGPSGLRLTGTSHIEREAKESVEGVRRITVKRLDSLIADFPRLTTTRLIKCDVEGYELFVFRGASDVLDRARPFVILETGNFELHGYDSKDVFAFFSDRRYLSFAMIGDKVLAPTNDRLENAKSISVNRVLIPEERMEEIRNKFEIVG